MLSLKVDPGKLPKAEDLKAHMFPSTVAVAVDDQAVRFITREAFPDIANLAGGGAASGALIGPMMGTAWARFQAMFPAAAPPAPPGQPAQAQGPGGPPGFGRPGFQQPGAAGMRPGGGRGGRRGEVD